ncbi:RDD family protein [Streptacidiphilus sp. P02-A3a]|uniref:RDD family protein n=1 Tax=Streptacidiphilus sp. P02-A3a TaxID=2704468 RepID=UPI0015FB5CEE|nr:RDD family protein [Streptacidiphilus sp. P02-A3a]QMU67909.1 DUF2510 domain-containing protein [Streptacidiphilus sp. P02-A3a]
MSVPPSAGSEAEDRPSAGYYPDPSIPGYVRYWDGGRWLPGTSRPAPPDGEVLAPPRAATRPNAPSMSFVPPPAPHRPVAESPLEESGPIYLDETSGLPLTQSPPLPGQHQAEGEARNQGGGEAADGPWRADAAQQRGLMETGRVPRWVSWGAPAQEEEGPSARLLHLPTSDVQPSTAPPHPRLTPVPDSWPVPEPAAGPAPFPAPAAPAAYRPPAAYEPPAARVPAHQAPVGHVPAEAEYPAPALPARPVPTALSVSPPPQSQAAPYRVADRSAVPSPTPGDGSGALSPAMAAFAAPAPPAPVAAPEPAAAPAAPVAPALPATPATPATDQAPRHIRAVGARQSGPRPALLGRRLGARLLDLAVVVGAVTPIAVPLVRTVTSHLQQKIDLARNLDGDSTVWLVDPTVLRGAGVLVLAVLLVGLVYEALPTALWGRTLGKALFGLRVLDLRSKRKPGPGRVLARWFSYQLLLVLAVGVFDLMWCMVDRPWRQCWHDKAGGTYVTSGAAAASKEH